ncbi:response regulator [Paenibacillus rhizovicinus]|uniref:Response regulator n=1 Tax=Paenibacillus rhizovicinus TaxID=2704463 RepID=A0A6C0P841_9BACL|nr:response regulator [Paenibacillus rhizovicinus]QHW34545.1 response regulator [Paenibacillus rhizovicinus]
MIYVLILLLACGGLFLRLKRRQRENNRPVITEHVPAVTETSLPDRPRQDVIPIEPEPELPAREGEYAVLVADDQPLIRMLLKELFQQDGITVYEAGSGVAAVEAVRNHRVDFVLLDLNMPDMNGIEAIKQIRLLNETVEAAFITGYGDPELLNEAKRYGVHTCFTKPFDLDLVIMHVKDCWNSVKYRDGVVS